MLYEQSAKHMLIILVLIHNPLFPGSLVRCGIFKTYLAAELKNGALMAGVIMHQHLHNQEMLL
jgi:hypothetical protein